MSIINYGNIDNNKFKFNTLYHNASKNKRQWTVYIRLVELKPKDKKITKNNWDLEIEKEIKLNKEWFTNNILGENNDNLYAQYWTESGVINSKITRYSPSYFRFKNKGRKNQTNPFQTALVVAKHKYKKQIEKGSNININTNTNTNTNININQKYFPMLIGKYEKNKTKLNYPIFVQPKLDGVRCIAFLKIEKDILPNYNNVILYSRTLKLFIGHNHIRKSLFKILYNYYKKEKKIIYLDGELYVHGKELQDIVSMVRNQKKQNDEIQYHLFDYFDPIVKEPFKKRFNFLTQIYENIKNKNTIQLIFMLKINNNKILFNKLDDILTKGYEGLIIRNFDEFYLTSNIGSNSNIRSKKTLKLKKKITNEYKIINFLEGTRGNSKGAIIWVCQTNDSNYTFKVTPKNMNFEERKNLFLDVSKNFSSRYKGRMLTVEFDAVSKKKIPLRAKALTIRDYE